MKTLQIFTKKYCPNFYELMASTNQINIVCTKMLMCFGSTYLFPEQILTIIDSFLVCDWRGIYERIIIFFGHIEDLILKLAEEDKDLQSKSQGVAHSILSENPEFQDLRLQSIREYMHSSNLGNIEFTGLNKEDLSFENFVDLIDNFNRTYIIDITDQELEETRKEAFKLAIDTCRTPPDDKEINKHQFMKIKSNLASG